MQEKVALLASTNMWYAVPIVGPDDTLQVSVEITNTGERAGKEVVQLYVRDEQARLQRPKKN